MSVSFWTMFCVVYGGVLFLSLKRGAFALVLGFLSGLGVAFFCLRYLPGVFTSQAFYAVAAGEPVCIWSAAPFCQRKWGKNSSCCVPPAGFWVSGWEYGWIFCIFNPDFTGNPGE